MIPVQHGHSPRRTEGVYHFRTGERTKELALHQSDPFTALATLLNDLTGGPGDGIARDDGYFRIVGVLAGESAMRSSPENGLEFVDRLRKNDRHTLHRLLDFTAMVFRLSGPSQSADGRGG